MMYLVAYDVEEDDVRRRVSQTLKDAGGVRIQYSAFMIELEEHQLESLLHKLRVIIGSSKGRVTAMPLCKRDLERMVTIVRRYRLAGEESPVI